MRKTRRATARAVWAAVLIAALLSLAALAFEPVWPVPTDNGVRKDGSLTIDAGNSSLGYMLVTGIKTDKKLKFRVAYGETTLTYDLNNDGETEILPLQLGSGSYTCTLYQQTSGKKYSQAGRITLNVKLEREDAAYLCPNKYVSYTADSKVVQLSNELCGSAKSDKQKLEAVMDYVSRNFMYDYVKALTVAPSTLPDIDACFERNMGICQDLSALTVAMLRVQGIPARLVVGYVDGETYHAWVEATVDGEAVFFDPTMACQGLDDMGVYTEEKSY